MTREKQQKSYSKSRKRAGDIHRDIFEDHKQRDQIPSPEDSPFPVSREETRWPDFDKDYGEECPPTLVDGNCLGNMAKASTEGRKSILDNCRVLDDQETNNGPSLGDIVSKPPIIFEEGIDWKFDRCAWYRPIHFHRENFGIFIKRRCIERIAEGIAGAVNPANLTVSMGDAVRYCRLAAASGLLLHEFYHHKVEAFGVRLGIAKSHFDMRNTRRAIPYLEYSQNVYQQLIRHSNDSLTDKYLMEEALANAYAYRQLSQIPYRTILPKEIHEVTRICLKTSFRFQPPGYRMAGDYLGNAEFAEGERILQQQILEGAFKNLRCSERWHSAPGMLRSIFLVREVPTHIIL
jgi:hypothetical protein